MFEFSLKAQSKTNLSPMHILYTLNFVQDLLWTIFCTHLKWYVSLQHSIPVQVEPCFFVYLPALTLWFAFVYQKIYDIGNVCAVYCYIRICFFLKLLLVTGWWFYFKNKQFERRLVYHKSSSLMAFNSSPEYRIKSILIRWYLFEKV